MPAEGVGSKSGRADVKRAVISERVAFGQV